MSGERIGKFQVVGTLGTGAHSTILHIRRLSDGGNYALKVVPIHGTEEYKFLEQAQHEYRVARMLSHPNIARVYNLEVSRDWLFRVKKVQLLIEYVNGKTLDACPPLGLPRLVQVFQKVAAGLAHMHLRRV
jgi:serine/threonine protein kinase